MKFIFTFFLISFSVLNADATCYQQIKERLPNNGIIIFGELHGTNEIPQFFSDCAQEFISHNESIKIFLEYPSSEDNVVEKFMQGEINENDLIQEPHWARTDGRSSQAMLAVFRDLKSYSARGLKIHGFDSNINEGKRTQVMVDHFMAAYSKNSYNLILTGNIHAKLTQGLPWDANYIPFAMLLKKNVGNMISLDADYLAGTAWICSPKCGITKIGRRDDESKFNLNMPIVFSDKIFSYDGYFYFRNISASPPAIEK